MARALAILFGLVLLLPGACAFVFMIGGISALPPIGSAEWASGDIWGLIGIATLGWGFCYLISFAGVMIIRGAARPAAPPPPRTPDGRETGSGGAPAP